MVVCLISVVFEAGFLEISDFLRFSQVFGSVFRSVFVLCMSLVLISGFLSHLVVFEAVEF